MVLWMPALLEGLRAAARPAAERPSGGSQASTPAAPTSGSPAQINQLTRWNPAEQLAQSPGFLAAQAEARAQEQSPTPEPSGGASPAQPSQEQAASIEAFRNQLRYPAGDPRWADPETFAREVTDPNWQQRNEERDRILGREPAATTAATELMLGFSPNEPVVKELSTEEYEGLSDRQRSLVDYNTMMQEAVSRDLANQKVYAEDVTDEQRAEYDKISERYFGKSRGSDRYAPETLATLRQLKLSDELSDLDDYLDYRAFATTEDLEMFERDPDTDLLLDLPGTLLEPFNNLSRSLERVTRATEIGVDDPARFAYIDGLAERTSDLTATLQRGNMILKNMSSTARFQNTWADEFGAVPSEEETPLGYGVTQMDENFQAYFDAIANAGRDTSPQEIQQLVWESLDENNIQRFYDYAEGRLRNAELYNLDLGNTEGVKYRSPEEVRDLLGITAREKKTKE